MHADIKPSNLMLKSDQIKIVDFGSSLTHKMIKSEPCKLGTTYSYKGPEAILGYQLEKPEHLRKLDMWSFGCVAVELYFGKPIFYGSSEDEVLENIQRIIGKPSATYLARCS